MTTKKEHITQHQQQFNDGEWVLVAQTTNAKVTRSYRDKDGNQVSEDNKYKGTPKEVRSECTPRLPGEALDLQYAHTWSTYVFEEHNNQNHGETKRHVEKEIQTNGFGNNVPARAKELPTSQVLDYQNKGLDPEHPTPLPPEAGNEHKTGTLKNMIDQAMADNRAQWIIIVGIAILAAVALFR